MTVPAAHYPETMVSAQSGIPSSHFCVSTAWSASLTQLHIALTSVSIITPGQQALTPLCLEGTKELSQTQQDSRSFSNKKLMLPLGECLGSWS